MTMLPFVPDTLRVPLRLALLAALALVIVSTVLPWYEATSSVRGSIRGFGSESQSSSLSYVMWTGRPLFALLLFASASSAIGFTLLSSTGGTASKLRIVSSAAVAMFAIIGIIAVPAGASMSSDLGGMGRASSTIEFSAAWGGTFGVLFAALSLLLAAALSGGTFLPPKQPS